MDKKIYGILILLISLLAMGTMVGTVSAQSQFFYIYTYDSYGNPAGNTYVTIYKGTYEVKHNYTDDKGVWTTQLDLDTRYRITASKGGQYGDWNGMADSSQGYRISIYMH